MVDDELRRLERRFRETGDAADEGAYLRAAVRAGALSSERLDLAAYLGHEGAGRGQAVEVEKNEGATPLERCATWVQGLAKWGEEALWRAGAAVVRSIPIYADRFDGPDDRLLEVMDRIEDWILSQAEEARVAVNEGPALLAGAVEQAWGAAACANATHWLCRSISEPGFESAHCRALVAEAGHELGPQRIERAVRQELLPWALGRADPLRERPRVGGRYLGHEAGLVRRVAFGPAGEALVASGRGGLRVWDLATGQLVRELSAVPRDPYSLAWSADRILVGDVSGALRVLSADDGRELSAAETGGGGVRDLALLPGSRAALACHDGTVQVWRIGAEPVLERVLEGHRATVNAVDADGARLLSACREGEARLWDLDGAPLGQPLVHGDGIQAALLLPGERVVTGGEDSSIQVWARGEVARSLEGHTSSVYALSASPGGARLASASGDGTVRLWDPGSGEQLACWHLRGVILTLAFAPGGDLLVGTRRGSLRVYEA